MAYKIISPLPVIEGGSGVQSNTSYAVLCGGTASTNPIQSIASVGTAGQILTSNGAGALPTFQNGVNFITYTNVNSSPYIVLSTDDYLSVDCSGGAITIQLPNAATLSRTLDIKDRKGSAATHNITVTTVGGAVDIDGATTFVMNTAYESISIIGNASTYEVF